MSCTRDDFSNKISLKEQFWQDLIGVYKITLLLKDPVEPIAGSFQARSGKTFQVGWVVGWGRGFDGSVDGWEVG